MTTDIATERVTLYYRQGSSDKVYQAAIEPSGPGFAVTFAYGRRGSTLNTGTKTAEPVGYDEARKIFDKLVRDKTAKGYTSGEDGTPYQQTDKAERATGIVPQLCNPIDETEARRLLSDPAWLTQEKFDGKRLLVQRRGDSIIGINRNGLTVSLPKPIVKCAAGLPSQQFLIDGECVGDTFIAFDLLEYACVDLRSQPYRKRLDKLYCLPIAATGAPIATVRTASKPFPKRAMLADLRQQNREGIVFKRIDAPHTPGRPASGGDWLKLKFTATCSCIVAGTNGSKRSVRLELIDGSKRVGVGNVTIPPGQIIPVAGTVVEIRYLYAFRGGSVYQPVYLGPRDDVVAAECGLKQLRFKADGEIGDDI
jgi:bifunctional non-homologous end joining protein LigD